MALRIFPIRTSACTALILRALSYCPLNLPPPDNRMVMCRAGNRRSVHGVADITLRTKPEWIANRMRYRAVPGLESILNQRRSYLLVCNERRKAPRQLVNGCGLETWLGGWVRNAMDGFFTRHWRILSTALPARLRKHETAL
jgi:hypothetical protein